MPNEKMQISYCYVKSLGRPLCDHSFQIFTALIFVSPNSMLDAKSKWNIIKLDPVVWSKAYVIIKAIKPTTKAMYGNLFIAHPIADCSVAVAVISLISAIAS